ncbi:MAG: hypothetical protein ACI9V1_003561 [Spirosomataceae bacterium]|jgi:hypothetical protein
MNFNEFTEFCEQLTANNPESLIVEKLKLNNTATYQLNQLKKVPAS